VDAKQRKNLEWPYVYICICTYKHVIHLFITFTLSNVQIMFILIDKLKDAIYNHSIYKTMFKWCSYSLINLKMSFTTTVFTSWLFYIILPVCDAATSNRWKSRTLYNSNNSTSQKSRITPKTNNKAKQTKIKKLKSCPITKLCKVQKCHIFFSIWTTFNIFTSFRFWNVLHDILIAFRI
jgi:hypothetical protein